MPGWFSFNITDKISSLVEGINLTNESVDQYNIVGPVSKKGTSSSSATADDACRRAFALGCRAGLGSAV